MRPHCDDKLYTCHQVAWGYYIHQPILLDPLPMHDDPLSAHLACHARIRSPRSKSSRDKIISALAAAPTPSCLLRSGACPSIPLSPPFLSLAQTGFRSIPLPPFAWLARARRRRRGRRHGGAHQYIGTLKQFLWLLPSGTMIRHCTVVLLSPLARWLLVQLCTPILLSLHN